MPPRAVLFDFDGTLVQTRDSSWALFSETNKKFDLGVNTQQDFFALLEDNMFASLKRLAGDDRRGEEAAKHFLDLLQTAYFPDFVPGMCDVVRSLAGNCSLAVLSSNSMAAIRRILTAADLAHCFSHVFTGDVEPDKRASVRRFLTDESYAIGRACSPAYLEGSKPTVPTRDEIVLVTDTVGDVRHARECGIRSIGVAWGMHSEEKLLAAGAEAVALWPQEIVAHLLPGGYAAAVCEVASDRGLPARTLPGMSGDRPMRAGSPRSQCACGCDPLETATAIRRDRILSAAETLRRSNAQPVPPKPKPRSATPPPDTLLRSAIGRISTAARSSSVPAGTSPRETGAGVPRSATAGSAPDTELLHALSRLRPGSAPQSRTTGQT